MADSVMEVNIDERTRKKIVQDAENPTLDMFDNALTTIDRDIARSLQAFFVTEIFLSYYEHKELIEDLVMHELKSKIQGNLNRERSETIGHNESAAEVLVQVRKSFNTNEQIFLKRHFDVSSAFTYEVRSGTQEGPQVGWGVDRGLYFFFFNMQEELVLKVLSASLLGKGGEEEGDYFICRSCTYVVLQGTKKEWWKNQLIIIMKQMTIMQPVDVVDSEVLHVSSSSFLSFTFWKRWRWFSGSTSTSTSKSCPRQCSRCDLVYTITF